MEMSGTIRFVASDGEALVIGIDAATEPYVYVPSNASEVHAFASHVESLTDRMVIITFADRAGPNMYRNGERVGGMKRNGELIGGFKRNGELL